MAQDTSFSSQKGVKVYPPEDEEPADASSRESSNQPGPLEPPTQIPVTPGIHLSTYHPTSSHESSQSSQSSHAADAGGSRDNPGYFPKVDRGVVASPDPLDASVAQSPSQAAAGAKSGHEILRRMSLGAMGGRRQSMSDFRAAHPDLSLSGNIISATFNIPHALKYRKGSDWVRLLLTCCSSSLTAYRRSQAPLTMY